MRAFLAFFSLLLAGAAFAQGTQGIGFAQTNERAWLCRHENLEEAMACARELCAEQAAGQTCTRSAWCYPGGWSGVMLVWQGSRPTTKVICGAPSEAGLNRALRAFCSGSEMAAICDVVTIVDPNGNERSVQGVVLAGGAAPTAAATEDQAPEPAPQEQAAQ
jgi:hypothetical protein